MQTTITRNQAGRTNHAILFSKTKGQIEYYYREGRINQSEFELYMHFWDKLKDNNCNCAYCLIERGEKENLYNWLKDLNHLECDNFFCSFGWSEGTYYCMSNYQYYLETGFTCLETSMKHLEEDIRNKKYNR
jgi:hypothetical protein